MKDLKKELDFIELEERLEMVHLAQAEATANACMEVDNGCDADIDGVCDETPEEK